MKTRSADSKTTKKQKVVAIPESDGSEEEEVLREEFSELEEEEEDDNAAVEEDEDDDIDEDDSLDEDEDDNGGGNDDDEEEESDSEGDGDDEDEVEEEEARLNAVGSTKFANAMKSLLAVSEEGIPQAEPTKLFQRKTKLMKLDDQEKQVQLKVKQQQLEKQKFDMKNVVVLPEKDPSKINLERDLKRIATRGVVALFNAIGAHQRASAGANSTVGEASKESFLKMLQEKATGKLSRPERDNADDSEEDDNEAITSTMATTSGWKVLQEDYLENEDDAEMSDGKDDDAHAIDEDLEEEDSE